MAREELGTKRICKSCGTKFYDLNREPIICPHCQTIFELVTEAEKDDVTSDDKLDNKAENVELVDLEKADGDEDINVETEDIQIDSDDDDTFLAVDDDDDSVSDLIVTTQDDKEE